MEITTEDRFFYTNAVERLTEKFEIAREFVKTNGLSSMPMEELTNMMITGVKEWVTSETGEQWLSTLGYIKSDMVLSGTLSLCLSGSLCPVCSGQYMETYGMQCERCGRDICHPCGSIVDPVYHIGWCNECLAQQPITNLLIYNE